MENGQEKDQALSEEEEAMKYVLERELARPNTSYLKASMWVVGFVLGVYIIATSVLKTMQLLDLGKYLPLLDNLFIGENKVTASVIFYMVFYISFVIIFLKKAVIGVIRLYQRYASEDRRRSCVFKPTCSEYTILAIEKYGLIKGGLKAYDRLFKRCKGFTYRIDYP